MGQKRRAKSARVLPWSLGRNDEVNTIDSNDSSISTSLDRLDELEKRQAHLWLEMSKAYGGALYGMDLLAYGALNRSKSLISGFKVHIEDRNLICGGALLRLQIDTALRIFAAFLAKEPHEFAIKVMSGCQVRKMKDCDGNKMTDAYLVSKLAKENEWLPQVYERTSGYIHLSSVHIMSAISVPNCNEAEEGTFHVKMSEVDKPLPNSIYVEAIDAFCAATEIFLKYIEGWAFTKANPEIVEKYHGDD